MRRLAATVRAALAVVLALALFAPELQEFVSLQAAELSCGMSCRRADRSCACCHRAAHKKDTSEVQWTSADGCGKDCRQFAGLTTPPGVRPPAGHVLIAPAIRAARAAAPSGLATRLSRVHAALFQRPPPVLL